MWSNLKEPGLKMKTRSFLPHAIQMNNRQLVCTLNDFGYRKKSGKSLTESAVTSDREQLPEDDEINEDIYPRRIKNFERRKLKLEKEFDEREEIMSIGLI